MIKEIKIENFKSIHSLNLELGRLNVFIGANGSGKSNILEGIALVSAAKENKLDTEFLYARGVRIDDDLYMPSAFEINNNKPVIITISDTHTPPISVKIYKNRWSINVPSNKIHTETFNGNGQTHPSPFLIYAPENTNLRNFTEEGQIKPLGVRGEGLFKLLQKIIKNKPDYFTEINEHLRLIDWFESVEMPHDLMFSERRLNFKDSNLAEGLQYINQRSANEGILYLLFYLTLFISDDTPKFFAIDNIDNAMNPKLGTELIKLLAQLAKAHDKQVIVTTHNPAILDGLNLNDDMQRLFVISRNAVGHTKALRIHKDPIEKDKIPVKLSEQFLRGYIGGLNF